MGFNDPYIFAHLGHDFTLYQYDKGGSEAEVAVETFKLAYAGTYEKSSSYAPGEGQRET